MIGQNISHYKILKKLGEGGMGQVYLAEDTKLKRTAALKFLPSALTSDDTTRRRFVHEAQTASALDHPNMVQIYEIIEKDENAFIAMAYYDGGTLRDKIAQNNLTIEQVIEISMHIASGLQKAHDKDIIHRDIKPENILFSDEAEPKIIDFGLAKFRSQTVLTKTGSTLGTIAYMSPEQTEGQVVDHKTDIWALGVILYEMLAGERPFKGDYEQAIMYSIINEDPEFIGKIRNDVPAALEKVVSKALEKNPAKRFQSMDEMCEALQNALNEVQDGRTASALTVRLGRKQRRFLFRFTPILIVLIAIAFYLGTYRDAEAAPVPIVLLPLENINPDTEQEWFTEGMTDALITDLASIKGLRITSRSSAMKYKNSGKSPADISAELGVSYIIEGSVLRTGEMVKISVRLIDAANDEYLWGEGYQRSLTDVYTLQGEVAQAIAQQIKVNLTPGEESRLTGRGVVNPEAHQAYLQGNFHLYKLTRQGAETALDYFKLAAKLDSNYALAYAGISLVWGFHAQMGYMSMQEASKKAKPAAIKAMELNNNLPEVHYLLAITAGWGEWNWDLAVNSYENALRLNPNMAEARAYYSHVLFYLNQPEKAMEEIEHALKLDPFNTLYHAIYAMDLNYVHRYDKAIELLEETLRINPGDPISLSTLRTTYHQKKMYKEAIEIWRLSYKAHGDQTSLDALNRGFEEGGYHLALQRVAELKIKESKTKYIPPWQIGTLYTRAAMPDEALDWLEIAVDEHDPNSPYLKVDPIFDYMREETRFQALIKKIGLDK